MLNRLYFIGALLARHSIATLLAQYPAGRMLTPQVACMYIVCMAVVWDPDKAAANLAKHAIRFSDAELVLFDPLAITLEDLTAIGEQRHISLGADALGRILVVVHTYRDKEIRLISARRATRKERRRYEEGIRL